MDGIKGECLPDGKKEMQRPERIENVQKKNPCQSEEDALARDTQGTWVVQTRTGSL